MRRFERAARVDRRRITAEYRGLRRTSKGLASAVSLVASLDGPAIATTAGRERGLAAMLLLLRVELPRAVPATATRAEREDAKTVDMLADAMVRGRRMPACANRCRERATAVASVRQTVEGAPGRRGGGAL